MLIRRAALPLTVALGLLAASPGASPAAAPVTATADAFAAAFGGRE
jgi:hypothetical protein